MSALADGNSKILLRSGNDDIFEYKAWQLAAAVYPWIVCYLGKFIPELEMIICDIHFCYRLDWFSMVE